jgi:seryl-tRNA synthetase
MNKNRISILIIQIIIGVIVSSGLLAVWFINYFSPILSAKNELALLNSEIIKKQAEFQKQINEEETHKLNETIELVNKKLNDAQVLNKKYESQLQYNKENLQKEKKQYSEAQIKELADGKELSPEVKSKIQKLEAQIENIQFEQNKVKANSSELSEILTFSKLEGLWKEDGSIDGKNVYIEFLPKGSIRTYAGLDGVEYIFSNQKWVIENNKIVILTTNDKKELKNIGEFKNGKIIGTQELSSGGNMKWVLERAR